MHEFSLARSILVQADQLAAAHGGSEVLEISVRCGSFAGVDPWQLEEAFGLICGGSRTCARAKLRVTTEVLEASCRGCGAKFTPAKFSFICLHCGSHDTVTTAGEEIILENIVLQ